MSLAGAGALVTSIFGAGNSQHGSGTSTNKTGGKTVAVQNNHGRNITRDTDVNKGVTTNKGTSQTNTQGTTGSKAVSLTNTNTAGTSGTTQTATSGGTVRTVGTADNKALAAARGMTATALKDSTDQSKVQGLIDSTLGKAAIAFAPTLAAGTAGSGLYNSSTVDLLSGFAKGQAVADAAGQVLNYQQGEQQIAAQSNQSILDATKGSTAVTQNVSTGQSNTTNQQYTNSSNKQNTDTTNQQSTSGETTDVGTSTDINRSVQDQKTAQSDKGSNTTNLNNTSSSNQDTAGNSGGVLSEVSLVCKEMKRIGKMDMKLWAIVTSHFMYHTSTLQKKAYWAWAEPFVKYMRKKPDSKLVKLVCWLTHERAVYVAAKFKGEHGLTHYEETKTGWIAYWAIWSFSFLYGVGTVLIPHLVEKYYSSKKWKEFDEFDRSIP